MPLYELCVVFRKMPKSDLFSSIKRSATAIYEHEGFLRSIEHLGSKALPHTMFAHGMKQKEGHYYLMKFDAPPSCPVKLTDYYRRDIDIIKNTIFKVVEPAAAECTLHEETLPAPYRKNVQALIEKQQARRIVGKVKKESHVEIYPFQR